MVDTTVSAREALLATRDIKEISQRLFERIHSFGNSRSQEAYTKRDIDLDEKIYSILCYVEALIEEDNQRIF